MQGFTFIIASIVAAKVSAEQYDNAYYYTASPYAAAPQP